MRSVNIDCSGAAWDEHQAASYLGVQVSTLRKRRWAGMQPKFLKVGRLVRYRKADLDKYLDACAVEPCRSV